jgi:hypothetical protein
MPDHHRPVMPQVTAVYDRFGTHRCLLMSLLHTCRVAAVALAAAAARLVPVPSGAAIDTGFQYQINPQHNFGKCLDIGRELCE